MKIVEYFKAHRLTSDKYELSDQHCQKISEGVKRNWEKRRKLKEQTKLNEEKYD